MTETVEEEARRAVLERGVDPEVAEYVAGVVASLLEDVDDTADPEAVREELQGVVLPLLEGHGVAPEEFTAFCDRVVRSAFPDWAGHGAGSGGNRDGNAGETLGTAGDCSDKDCLCYVPNMILMYGGSPEPLLKNTAMELIRGHRYGVVGANGTGKTTLMARIAAKDIGGFPQTLRCVHLRHDKILDGIGPTMSAEQYARLRSSGEDGASAVTASEDLARALRDIGFDSPEKLRQPVASLSGGWQMRLALACAVAQKANVWLLDEPTNHLDVSAIAFLVNFINTLSVGGAVDGTCVIIISHDADFLNQVCTDVIHFTPDGKLSYHPGNFDVFKARELHGDDVAADRVLRVGARHGVLWDGPSADGAVDTRPASGGNRLALPNPERVPNLSKTQPEVIELRNASFRHNPHQDFVIFDVTVRLTPWSRVAVVGPNGSGKSTLLALLAGRLEPTKGELWCHENLRVSYIAQQHMSHLADFMTCKPLEYIQLRFRHGYDAEAPRRITAPSLSNKESARIKALARQHGKQGKEVESLVSRQNFDGELRYEVKWKDLSDANNTFEKVSRLKKLGVEHMVTALDDFLACAWAGTQERSLTTDQVVKHLEPFGLGEDVTCNRQISMLSSGQKSKLMLGASFWTRPHIVCLDEPTNYIDTETIDTLQEALRSFRGGLVIVTHSRSFVENVCDEFWEVADGHVAIQIVKDHDHKMTPLSAEAAGVEEAASATSASLGRGRTSARRSDKKAH